MGVVGSKFGSHTGSRGPEEQFEVWGLGLYITTEQSKQDQYSTPLMLESGENSWPEFYRRHRTNAQTDAGYTLDDFERYLQQYYQHTKFALVTEAVVSGFVTLPAQVTDLFGGNVRVNEWMSAYQAWYDRSEARRAREKSAADAELERPAAEQAEITAEFTADHHDTLPAPCLPSSEAERAKDKSA